MTTRNDALEEAAIDAIARSDAAYDGRPFDGLGRADKDRYRDRASKSYAAIRALKSTPAPPSGKLVEEMAQANLDRVLAEFERRTRDVPVGHEIPSRGASTYNWRMCHLDEFREIALSLDVLTKEPRP